MAKRKKMVRFQMRETSGVDRPAQAPARVALIKGAVAKRLRLTTSVKGHSHLLDDDAEGGQSSYERRAGQEEGHSHPWVKMQDGTIVVGDADGHSHDVVSTEKRDVDGAWHAEQRRAMAADGVAMPDGSFPILSKQDVRRAGEAFARVPEEFRSAVAGHVAKRAEELGCDELPEAIEKAANGGRKGEETMTDKTKTEADERFAAVEKRAVRAESIAALPVDQLTYFKALDGVEAQDAFLAKTKDARADIVTAAAAEVEKNDPIVYTAADGAVFRKSDDARLVSAVKRADEEARSASAERALRKRADLEKRAESELAHLPGEAVAKVALLSAVDGIEKAEDREAVLSILKAGDDAIAKAYDRVGTADGGADDSAPLAKLDELAKAKAAADGTSFEKAYDAVLNTDEGRQLYAASRS